MKRFLQSSAVIALLSCMPLWGQVTLDVTFEDVVRFYVSSVDMSTGATTVPLFTAIIDPTDGPVDLAIRFRFSMQAQYGDLDFDFDDNIISMTTREFRLHERLVVRNTDLEDSPSGIVLVDDGGNPVEIKIAEKEMISGDQRNDMISALGTTFPVGNYKIEVALLLSDGSSVERSYIIEAYDPVSLNLSSPGSVLSELEHSDPTTTDPNFQWETDQCNVCEYHIRVAKYDCDGSIEDAIEGQTVLPMDQSGFERVIGSTSFQWPSSDVIDLLPGNSYVWQIKKVIPTSRLFDDELLSDIFVFRVRPEQGSEVIKQLLEELLAPELVEQYYSNCGELMGFIGDESTITLDGIPIDMMEVNTIKQAIQDQVYTIRNVEVQ